MTIEIGTAIVSYIEPHPGQAVAFNRWYERRPLPRRGQGRAGSLRRGSDSFATACKELRPLRAGCSAIRPTVRISRSRGCCPAVRSSGTTWVGREMETIAAEGRLFAVATTCTPRSTSARGTSGDDRRRSSHSTTGSPARSIVADCEREAPRLDLPAVIGLRLDTRSSRRSIRRRTSSCSDSASATRSPSSPRRSPALDGCGLASPFLATVPGTDTYADDL